MAEKNIVLIINDLRQAITKAVNEANLPFCITEPILKDFHEQAVHGAEQELRIEAKKYADACKADACKEEEEKGVEENADK